MDGILVLIALVALAIPVSIIVLFVGQAGLRRRIAALEADLALRADLATGVAERPAPTAPVEAQPEPEAAPAPGPPPPQVVAGAETAPLPMASSVWNRARKGGGSDFEPQTPREAADVATEPPEPAVPSGPSLAARLFGWLSDNWVYAVAAASLALAGVFFVQYGIENGLLPPAARVAAALLFGLALVAAGEWLRRRHGDGEEVSTAYLPSVFSGAGIVSIFAAIVAARQMYGLIDEGVAFAGLMATAAGAVALGWFSGPLLVVVGLLGAALAPFVVGGNSGAAPWLYGHSLLVLMTGLAVDTVRKWRWLSVLALVLAHLGAGLSMLAGAGVAGHLIFLALSALLTVILSDFALIPRLAGPALAQAVLARGQGARESFQVRLAHGAMLAATLGLVFQAGIEGENMLAFALLAGLAVLVLLWADRAEGLDDLALWPALGLLARVVVEATGPGAAYWAFTDADLALRAPETAPPMTVSLILGMAVMVGLAAAWRSFRPGWARLGYGLAAVLVAPLTAAGLELFWQPSRVLGAFPWAVQVIALAALMTVVALRYAKGDDGDFRRAAYATLSALSLIALALFLLTTKAALTLALAVLALVAALLDRRFRLPEMGLFVQVAAAVLSWRLVADPGLDWALAAPLGQVVLAFGGTLAALTAAWVVVRPLQRVITLGIAESAVAGLSVVFVNVLISRWLMARGQGDVAGHWQVGVRLLPFLALMAVQLYRAEMGGKLRLVRQGLALIAAVCAAGLVLLSLTVANPLLQGPWEGGAKVLGPMVLDTLLLAYGLPGLALLALGLRFSPVARRRVLRLGALVVGSVLVLMWIALEIRRFWQGDVLGVPGVRQEELYSYTVAMLLIGAGLLYQAIARRSSTLRAVAMAVIGLTAAKVFLIDAAGLSGLTRVLSFLGLGLSLAGLAWLNRWAGQATARRD